MRKATAVVIEAGILLAFAIHAAGPAFAADIGKGKEQYDKKRCSMCHSVGGKGGKMGPDLSDVGNKRDADWMAKFLKDPKGTAPDAKHSAVKATDEEIADLAAYLASLK